MTKAVTLPPLWQAKYDALQLESSTCLDCGDTKTNDRFQVRKRKTQSRKDQVPRWRFDISLACRKCENAAKRRSAASEGGRKHKTPLVHGGPIVGTPEHSFFCT